jgi:hypothetical protein
MYNYVWNKVFRSGEQAERSTTNNTVATVLNRSRSFQNILVDSGTTALPTETVSTGGTGFDIQDLRAAQATQRQERWNYYFNGPDTLEYVNMLSRFGVQVGSEIDDGPRLIGKLQARGSFETVVDQGGATSTGSPSGFWSGAADVKFGGFSPEHGFVAAYLVPRMEFPVEDLDTTPIIQKENPEDFFTMATKAAPTKSWSDAYQAITVPGLYDRVAPAWEEYRTPPSSMFASLSSGSDDNYAVVGSANSATGEPDRLRDWDGAVVVTDFFRDFIGNNVQLATYTEVNGDRRSPVPPRQFNT